MSLVAGVDPGRDGAICILNDGKIHRLQLLHGVTVPDFLAEHGVKRVWIEKAQSMGKETPKSMFTYGQGYGYMLGTFHGKPFDIDYIAPAVWTGLLHQKSPIPFANPKACSLYVARTLWPEVDWRVNSKCRTPHDGYVDAALIAYYGWIQDQKSAK